MGVPILARKKGRRKRSWNTLTIIRVGTLRVYSRKKTIEMIVQFLEKNNIPLLDGAKKRIEVQILKTMRDAMHWWLEIMDISPQVPQGTWILQKNPSLPFIHTVVHPFSWEMTQRSKKKGLVGLI